VERRGGVEEVAVCSNGAARAAAVRQLQAKPREVVGEASGGAVKESASCVV